MVDDIQPSSVCRERILDAPLVLQIPAWRIAPLAENAIASKNPALSWAANVMIYESDK